ncbi:MAG TPA: sulfotransferase family protein, partial [Myxococcota bacterium]|nr:sulfotransferase family protein [Myxococcota bacterium]
MALSAPREARFDGFVPYRIEAAADPPCVLWCRLGDRRFTEPFFEETIQAALDDPFALVFQHRTSLDRLREFAPPAFGPEPAGFVFHLSRCGSTLVSQMLASLPSCVVLSEPAVLDSLLRALHAGAEGDAIPLLRGLVGALGRPRADGERRLFVKLDSWHVHALPLLRRAFPDVPWIFLLRDPLELLVSHRRERGAQMIPGALTLAAAGLDLAD